MSTLTPVPTADPSKPMTSQTDLSDATSIDPQRLRKAMKSYNTRHVAQAIDADPDGYALLTGADVRPAAGDLVVARVVEVGKHTRLEGPGSRRQLLFTGQEILVAYGDRYAPDQFLAEVPQDLRSCHLVAAGGIAGVVTEQHATVDDPTVIEPLGLLADSRGRVTLDRHAPYELLGAEATAGPRSGGPQVIAVLGTSMNSGKSTTLACLVNGLANAGLVVSAGKATGTGAGNDANSFRDAAAARVLDFTDFGLSSTYKVGVERVRDLWSSLVHELAGDGPDVVVVEIADGVYQHETAALLASPSFAASVDGVVFAAQDALGAAAGVAELQRNDLSVLAVSGLLTASPLASTEARAALPIEVVDTYDLCLADVAAGLVPAARATA